MLCAQTRGWADICNIAAFYHEKSAHVHIITTFNGILHTSGIAKLGHTWARALATRGDAPPVQVSMQIIGTLLITNQALNSLETKRLQQSTELGVGCT